MIAWRIVADSRGSRVEKIPTAPSDAKDGSCDLYNNPYTSPCRGLIVTEYQPLDGFSLCVCEGHGGLDA